MRRLTHRPGPDGGPFFSQDGKRLVFASNRHNRAEGDPNIFLADWIE